MGLAKLTSDLEEEIVAIVEETGCDLYAIEVQGGTLRIVLDREDDGVTIEHCTSVSRQVSALLDVHDFGKDRYTLEVSSPGLDRPLRGPDEYRRFVGRLARITFAAGEATQTVVGRMERYEDEAGDGVVAVLEPDTDRSYRIPLRDIRRARLEIEL